MANDVFDKLSDEQRKVHNFNGGTVVIKACPGSGKTFSVSARIARLMSLKSEGIQSIAALSFTNVACEEISSKLKTDFGISWFGKSPHYLGTLDSFINQFIFLQFGHLVMNCNRRPELVGKPYSHWTKGKGERKYRWAKGRTICYAANPDEYFDCTTFNLKDELVPIVPSQNFHFSWKKYFNKDKSVFKPIQDIIDSKKKYFEQGFANQSDANYHALVILKKYPLIAEALARKFKYFIIDEAQDTDEIQMAIIELLHAKGAGNIMLVGDRDQSIFEWNDAMPELFDNKYEQWNKIELIENRRSSQRICNTIQPLSSFPRLIAVDRKVAQYDYYPEVNGFKWPSTLKKRVVVSDEQSKISFIPVLQRFLATCEQHSIKIDKASVAVLYRGTATARYLDINRDILESDKIPWKASNYHVKDIVRGKLLYENGMLEEGYRLVEKGFFEGLNKTLDPTFYCSRLHIDREIEKYGFKEHRARVFRFLNMLPKATGAMLNKWITDSNASLTANSVGFQLVVKNANSNVQIQDIFAGDLISNDIHPFYFGTIHSAKGKTFEAVLLILGKKPGNRSYYKTMLEEGPKDGEAEELRNVYVALSRPRRILMMAVPEEDVQLWKRKLRVQ